MKKNSRDTKTAPEKIDEAWNAVSTMKGWLAFSWVVILILAAVLLLGCSEGNDPTLPDPKPHVSFSEWLLCGHGGSVGVVVNDSEATAYAVQVQTSLCGMGRVSRTDPENLDPGQRGTFAGVSSDSCGLELRCPDEVVVRWQDTKKIRER